MRKVCELGRSMVEMLGVLAIIGVLSVGGIAGYSKAMRKHKLNKFSDGFNQLLNEAIRLNPILESSISMSKSINESIFETLNLMPEGMTYKADYIYDIFNNQLNYYYGYHNEGRTLENYFSITLSTDGNRITQEKSEVCHMILLAAKENSENIENIQTRNNVGTSYTSTTLYGDKSCAKRPDLCLKSATIDDIDNICYSCLSEDSCRLFLYLSAKSFW